MADQQRLFTEVLRERDAWMMEQVQSLNPERATFADQIAELKQDPAFASLPDNTLIAMAKRMAPKLQPKPRRAPAPPGGGQRVAGGSEGEPDLRQNPLYQQIYGDRWLPKQEGSQ